MATLSPPTLKTLLREARNFLNQPNAENSAWTDLELTDYINDAIRQYFLVINDNAEGQFDTRTTLDLVSGVETITLPTDLFEIRALYLVQNGQNQILPYRNNLTTGYSTQPDGGIDVYAPYYFLRGNDLVLRPIPGFNATGGLVLEYTHFPETLITGMDTLTNKLSPVFKELVVMFCCYKAKLKESSVMGAATYGPAEKHLSDLYNVFKQTVAGRTKYPQFIIPFNP